MLLAWLVCDEHHVAPPRMDNSVTRKPVPTYRKYGGLLLPLTPVDTEGDSARIVQPPEADSNRRFGANTFGRDPSLVVPAVASPEEIVHAPGATTRTQEKILRSFKKILLPLVGRS